jgi:pimeloyl-ACP methyl ester carboxylesterase
MPKVQLRSGLTLHYQQVGSGPDLVMVHGLTGNLAVWHLHLVPALCDQFRILTYDLRGHGYSDKPASGYSADDMAADLIELLDARGIDRAAVVGHSFGADVGLYCALLHPERVAHIVAIEAALPAMILQRARAEWEGWDYWSDVLEKSGHRVPPERRCDVDYLLRASLLIPKKWGPLNGLPRNPRSTLRLIESTSVAEDTQRIGSLTLENVEHIRTPTTLIYSASSAFLGTHNYLLQHLPNAQSVLLPATEWGHFGPLEQPEEVARRIRDCLVGVPHA